MAGLTLDHVVHPGRVDASSDLHAAQPVTFATMENAAEFARGAVDVRVQTVLFRDEADMELPASFHRIPELERSIADIRPFRVRRKLALLRDILDAGCRRSGGEYVAYTNADIALQPHFYLAVAALVGQGYDAFVINRRTIPASYTSLGDLPLMYAELGEPHPGYDCFVFRRDVLPLFQLGLIHVGSAGIGRALLANLVRHARRFRECRDAHLTFHLGDACAWRREEYGDYVRENWSEYLRLHRQLFGAAGGDPLVRSYLLETGPRRPIPDFDRFFIAAGRCLPLERP